MVYVCDAIMGTGKSQSAITYMNEHSNQKFIYITPFLEEAKRIKDGCSKLKFVEPDNKLYTHGNTKVGHTAYLIKNGRNVATTHQAFKNYTTEMLNDIRRLGYTLIIDENVSVLEKADFKLEDVQDAVVLGYLSFDGSSYTRTEKPYTGDVFEKMLSRFTRTELTRVEAEGLDPNEKNATTLFYWTLPPELITSFKDVFILAYLFRGQSLHSMLDMYDIPTEYIGVERVNCGNGFRFCCGGSYIPDYVPHIKDMIHIAHDRNLNDIGDSPTALSKAWFTKDSDNVRAAKSKIYSWFQYSNKTIKTKEKMWSAYNSFRSDLKGDGYSRGFVSFNKKSSNEYRHKTCLAYAVNLYMNVGEKCFYKSRGVDVSDDDYALSIMLQWIWRSAIRDGKEISIYIPSSRMRNLLIDWMNKITKEANEISHEKEDV